MPIWRNMMKSGRMINCTGTTSPPMKSIRDRQPPGEREPRQTVGGQAGEDGADDDAETGGDDAVAQRDWHVRFVPGLAVVEATRTTPAGRRAMRRTR